MHTLYEYRLTLIKIKKARQFWVWGKKRDEPFMKKDIPDNAVWCYVLRWCSDGQDILIGKQFRDLKNSLKQTPTLRLISLQRCKIYEKLKTN